MYEVDMSDLVGTVGDFYGAANNVFGYRGSYFEAVEDPDDGYRSCLDMVRSIERPTGLFGTPIAHVRVE